MKILICNERFLFRFGVDRVLLMLGMIWKKNGHNVTMMGNHLDSQAVGKCSDKFIRIPEAPDYLYSNDYTSEYLQNNWDSWFDDSTRPDSVLVAGWPFFKALGFFKKRCGCVIFHDHGAVPIDGMNEGQRIIQNELQKLRQENLRLTDKVIAVSSFLEETQSKKDVEGMVPTSHVYSGLDHIDMQLWKKDELQINQNNAIENIRKLKTDGYKIIIQPGRWESENYKNSSASIDVVRRLNSKKIKHKVLVLSSMDDMGNIPLDVRDNYVCLGFVDDLTMRTAMELSDAGFSPTLWEGFDLPLGEMQYLNRYMFVLNIGAHPEVVSNEYFLCESIDELSDKLVDALNGNVPFNTAQFETFCEKFRERFTWQNCADNIIKEMKDAILDSITVLIDVTNACHDTANSGVMRVARKVSRHLQKKINTVFIIWDSAINQYVFPYNDEIQLLCSYGGPEPELIPYKSVEGKTRNSLDDVFDSLKGKKKIHLFTETVDYKVMQKVTPYFHSKEVSIVSIFYDAIAVLRPELCSNWVSENHKKYMVELAECDLILPIALHNQHDLEEYWKRNGVDSSLIRTVPLAAEVDNVPRNEQKLTKINDEYTKILLVSTLEPRKNHIRFLNGFELFLKEHPELENKVSVHLIGNRYAGNEEIPNFVEDFCKSYVSVKWLGVVDDESLWNEYSDCTFTVYPSEIEGFGMPIIESLWFGKPCLCYNQGSIGELASSGGCCLVDILDVNAIAKSLYKMITDRDYLLSLQHQAVERKINTWEMYTNSICELFCNLSTDFTKYAKEKLPLEVKQRIFAHYVGWDGMRIITVSNYYPPNFMGGAEIIAHNQAETMQSDGLARVVAFSVDVTGEYLPGTIYLQQIGTVPVVRVAGTEKDFDVSGINFFSESINKIFDEICTLVKPTVVHCHNIIGTSLGIIDISQKHKAKICMTLHDNWGFCYKNTALNNEGKVCTNILDCDSCMGNLTCGEIMIPMGIRRSYFRRIFERVDAYISPSKYLANLYVRAGFSFHKMNVIWNGINIEKYKEIKKIPSKKLRLTFVGFFGKHKGIELLIKAVGLLDNKDIEINLVGFGAEQENYKRIALESGISHQLRFWGKLANQDIINAYAETDIYCLPSIWAENQPVSITEAMACGIPVIASDLGGNKELVQDGVTGYLFRAGDYEDLASKIKLFIDSKDLIGRLGDAGKIIMAQNDYHMQVKKLVALFNEKYLDYNLESKKLILIKGTILPTNIDKITNYDIILLDWAISTSDLSQTMACIIMPDEVLTPTELKKIKDYGIKLITEKSQYKRYENLGLNVEKYSEMMELMEMISML